MIRHFFKTFFKDFLISFILSFSDLNFLILGLLAILALNCFPFPDSSRSFFSPTVTYFYYFLFPLVLFTVLFSISLFHTFIFLLFTSHISFLFNVLQNYFCVLLLVIFNSLEFCRIQVVLLIQAVLSFVFHDYINIISH